MRIFAFIIFVLIAVGCQDIPPVEKPDNLIDREKMEEIVYEIAVVNAARGYNMQLLSKYGVNPETYIFEKFGIDSVQYAKSVTYYSSDIEGYRAMYQSVEKRVNKEFSYYDSLDKREKKIKDSLRTKRARELQREKDSIQKLDSIDGKEVKKKQTLEKIPLRVSKEIYIDSI